MEMLTDFGQEGMCSKITSFAEAKGNVEMSAEGMKLPNKKRNLAKLV